MKLTLKAQAIFAIMIEIWFVCLVFFFSESFGMGFEHKLFDMESKQNFI